MRLHVTTAALFVAMSIAGPGIAECIPTTSEPDLAAAGYYVDNDPCHFCMFSIWGYQESNGIDGLQRGDEVVDDTCGGMIPSDTIIF